MKKLWFTFLLAWYNFKYELEALINRLNGVKERVRLDHTQSQIVRQRENMKLKIGIQKLIRAIYGENGEVKGLYRGKDVDIIGAGQGYTKTTKEKMDEARIRKKMLDNPLDTTGTDSAMVEHTVKNAGRYQKELQRRTKAKALTKAMKDGNLELAKELKKEVKTLTEEIQAFKGRY